MQIVFLCITILIQKKGLLFLNFIMNHFLRLNSLKYYKDLESNFLKIAPQT